MTNMAERKLRHFETRHSTGMKPFRTISVPEKVSDLQFDALVNTLHHRLAETRPHNA